VTTSAPDPRERLRNTVAIAVVSLAGLLLEVGYTRIISYKLWYYYTYLVIGLALLGIGSGGIAVAVMPALKRASTRWIIASCSIWGAITAVIGFAFIARRSVDTTAIWQHDDWRDLKSPLGQAALLVVLWCVISWGVGRVTRNRRTGGEFDQLWVALGPVLATIAFAIVIVARGVEGFRFWDRDLAPATHDAVVNVVELGLICFAIFATFVALGVILATLLGRAREDLGHLYAADLAAAGLACVIAIPLISAFGPPAIVMISAALFLAVGLGTLPRSDTGTRDAVVLHDVVGIVAALVIALFLVNNSWIPGVAPDARKIAYVASTDSKSPSATDWGPVFRVDAQPVPNTREGWPPEGNSWLLVHDGTYGAGMHRFDGNAAALTYYDTDPRRIPFEVLDAPPARALIIGSAGGNEILASLHFGAKKVEAVELNPVTVRFLEHDFASATGNLPERPEVDLHQGDGRTYLARSNGAYDLIWFVAPDSYAANNAASSGAFVLSESYLYTSEMIQESLEHLSNDGIIVVQFGELLFANEEHPDQARPNRTSRYLSTARHALRELGVQRPQDHLLVAVETSQGSQPAIVVKRTPFTTEEISNFIETVPELKDTRLVYAPGAFTDESIPARLAGAPDEAAVATIVDAYPGEIGPITDDAPFFWHFKSFRSVLGEITDSWNGLDPEDSIGERVLLLLLAFAALYAAVFLFVPFLFVRKQWRALPSKGTSALYFACLGFGFMFFEITMIQRLVQFLGYPTRSLTVTLAALLISTGVGALVSKRFAANPQRALWVLLGLLGVLTVVYQVALTNLTESLLDQGLAVRIIVSVAVLVPLGLCLGMFMPLGLGVVSSMGDDGASYTAWAWAVNGFFSVIGSVLTTILAMEFGFSTVQVVAWCIYAIAVIAFTRLHRLATAIPAS
jgi:hypothetical protein